MIGRVLADHCPVPCHSEQYKVQLSSAAFPGQHIVDELTTSYGMTETDIRYSSTHNDLVPPIDPPSSSKMLILRRSSMSNGDTIQLPGVGVGLEYIQNKYLVPFSITFVF